MKNRILPLLLAALVLSAGMAPHVCAPGEMPAEGLAPLAAVEAAAPSTPSDTPPCHMKAEGGPPAHHGAPAASTQDDPAPSDRDGCCNGLAGAFCQHSCQTVGLVALSGLARPAVLSAGLPEPGIDRPAAPPLSGPDHVPLA